MDETTARRIVGDRRTFARVQKACDEKNLPYPPELIQYLLVVRKYRSGH